MPNRDPAWTALLARFFFWIWAFSSLPGQAGSTLRVSPFGSNQVPYADWATAATNPVAAVARARDGDTVLLTNGLYFLTEEIMLTNAVRLRSLNGPSLTIVDGMRSNRCIYFRHVGAVVEGLTIRNGQADIGGGVRFGEGGTLRACVVENNRATMQGGGGVYLRWHGLVEECEIRNNTAGDGDGGGVYCLSGGAVRNSVIAGNTARVGGGVVNMFHGELVNCLVVSNAATQAGGVLCSQYGKVRNCTIAHNTAKVAGGLHGFYGGDIINCIIYANSAPFGTNFFNLESSVSRTTFSHCCTVPVPDGPGNIGSDPAWIHAEAGNYRLRPDSPCIDAGRNDGAPDNDLDGLARPQDGDANGLPVVDMGAYEYSP